MGRGGEFILSVDTSEIPPGRGRHAKLHAAWERPAGRGGLPHGDREAHALDSI